MILIWDIHTKKTILYFHSLAFTSTLQHIFFYQQTVIEWDFRTQYIQLKHPSIFHWRNFILTYIFSLHYLSAFYCSVYSHILFLALFKLLRRREGKGESSQEWWEILNKIWQCCCYLCRGHLCIWRFAIELTKLLAIDANIIQNLLFYLRRPQTTTFPHSTLLNSSHIKIRDVQLFKMWQKWFSVRRKWEDVSKTYV